MPHGKPRWSFCAASDLHLGGRGTGVWNNRLLLDEAPALTRALVQRLRRERPAFLLLLGDLANEGEEHAFRALGELLAPLPCPVYPLLGNHDAVLPESRSWLRAALHPPGPTEGPLYYDFTHEGLHFACLDCVWQLPDGSRSPHHLPGARRMAVPDELLHWLDGRLAAQSARPAFVCIHIPPLRVREGKVARGARDSGPLGNAAELLAVLDRHPQVRAVLSAHFHLQQLDVRRGVFHSVGAALVEWPHGYRRFDVYADRVRVTTATVADAATRARSLLPGHEWAAGELDEQAFEIPL